MDLSKKLQRKKTLKKIHFPKINYQKKKLAKNIFQKIKIKKFPKKNKYPKKIVQKNHQTKLCRKKFSPKNIAEFYEKRNFAKKLPWKTNSLKK